MLTVVVLFIACGGDSATYWKDGNFPVYAVVDLDETTLGYNFHPGLLGLVEPEVVAAGSNAHVVIVERLEPATNTAEFHIVRKEASPDSHSGKNGGTIFTR